MNLIVKLLMRIRGSLNRPGEYNIVKKLEVCAKIPKIIHQIYHSKILPVELENNIRNIKAKNPDWEMRLYDFEEIDNYLQNNFPSLLRFYKKINPNYLAARADFFRYVVIYKEGGVYLDIKSATDSPLNSIIGINDKYILSQWPRSYSNWGQHIDITNPGGEFQQWHIISVAGHPFLKAVIDNVCNNIVRYNPFVHGTGAFGVINLTGPIAYTKTILRLLENSPHRLEKDHLALGLIYCATDKEGGISGHRQIFDKKHYSKLDEPVIIQSKIISFLFAKSKPFINVIISKIKSTL